MGGDGLVRVPTEQHPASCISLATSLSLLSPREQLVSLFSLLPGFNLLVESGKHPAVSDQTRPESGNKLSKGDGWISRGLKLNVVNF